MDNKSTLKKVLPILCAVATVVTLSVMRSVRRGRTVPQTFVATSPSQAFSQTSQPAGSVQAITLPGGAEMRFRWCPPGSFMMGSPESEEGRDGNERQHRVTLTKGFWLAETEVTQKQWKSVMGCNPVSWKTDVQDDRPVYRLSWFDCQMFIRKVNASLDTWIEMRLPTEAQWEYACRAGATGAYGGTGNPSEMGWFGDGQDIHPVAKKKPNAWGLYDMHGNAEEWCADWYGEYPSEDVTDPTGPADGGRRGRVLRGGCWNFTPVACRSASRHSLPQGSAYHLKPVKTSGPLGFRPALVTLP